MARVNVIDPETRELVGWFDDEKAERFTEDRWWNGSNWISRATGSQWHHEALYRTAGGRWVLHSWSQYQNVPEQYEFISDQQAREWLLKNGHDEAVERFFGPVEEERGPGRPEIGPAIQIRLPEEMLSRIDQQAKELGISRAERIRQLLAQAMHER